MGEDCELLISRLSEELATVKERLAAITHGLESQLTSRLQSTPFDYEESSPLAQSDSNLSYEEDKAIMQKRSKGTAAKLRDPEDGNRDIDMKDLLKIVDDREQEREELYKKRLLLMKCRIEQQLKELREKDSYLSKVRERRKRKEQALKLQKKPPRFRSSGEDDTTYMLKVYRSAMYQAMNLEYNLKKSGKLNKPSDIQYFWDYMFNLESSSPKATEERQSQSSLKTCQKKSLSMLEEEDEDYNKDYTNSWAITAQPPDEKDNSMASSSFQASSNEYSYDKLPKLRSVQEMLGDPVKLRYDIMKRQGSAKWGGKFEAQHMQLQKSYECSKANEILMRTRFSGLLQSIERSLSPSPEEQDQHQATLLQSPPPGSQPSSVTSSSTTQGSTAQAQSSRTGVPALQSPQVSITHEPQATASTESCRKLPEIILTKKPEATTKIFNGKDKILMSNESSKKCTVGMGHIGGIRKKKSAKFEDEDSVAASVQVVPLSMSALMKTSKVVEVKTKGTMWKNYILTET